MRIVNDLINAARNCQGGNGAYGEAVRDVCQFAHPQDLEALVEDSLYQLGEALFREDRRIHDLDHAVEIINSNDTEFRKAANHMPFVIIGFGFEMFPEFERRWEYNLPRDLIEAAGQAYRQAAAPNDGPRGGRGGAMSGYQADARDPVTKQTRGAGQGVATGRYRNKDKGNSFSQQLNEAPADVAPRYRKASEEGFAATLRPREQRRAPSLEDFDAQAQVNTGPQTLRSKQTYLKPFNHTTGVPMESYELHEIRPLRQEQVGIQLEPSPLIAANRAEAAGLKLPVDSEMLVESHLDIDAAMMLQLRPVPSVKGAITANVQCHKLVYTCPGEVSAELVEVIKFDTIDDVLGAIGELHDAYHADKFERLSGASDDLAKALSYVMTLALRYFSQVLTLNLGEGSSIIMRPEGGYSIALGEQTFEVDSLTSTIDQLMASEAYGWASEGIENTIKSGYIKKRLSLALEPSTVENDETGDNIRITTQQLIMNAPGHLDTNVTHVDTGDILKVDPVESNVFADSLKWIETQIVSAGMAGIGVILVDDYGYQIEFVTNGEGQKLFIQKWYAY